MRCANRLRRRSTWNVSIKVRGRLSLSYVYGATITEDVDTDIEIIHFAHQYVMGMLLKQAEAILVQSVTRENALEKLSLADELGVHDLRIATKKLISKLFLYVCETENFKKLPFRIFDEIVKISDLKILTVVD